jgi:8-oxo-dGTP pyrophosphatase MutT (NUDIX family)
MMNEHLLEDPEGLQALIIRRLVEKCGCESLFPNEPGDRVRASSVMLLLGEVSYDGNSRPEVSVILNKRSKEVRQGGDLCCPGGTLDNRLDPYLARILKLPGSPLTRWRHWACLRRECPRESRLLALLLATALRESWEEMRLNPLRVRFLGPLSSQCLILFRRVIHPMVAWVYRQGHFTLSWEVEKLVAIPLRSLLDLRCHALFQLHVPPQLEWRFTGNSHTFPCVIAHHEEEREVLWGATYRIVASLLELLFDFRPPPPEALPTVHGEVDECYVSGRPTV